MPHIEYVTDEDASRSGLYDKRSLYTEVRMHNPELVESQNRYHRDLMECGFVDEELFEYVMVVVAQANECDYCASSHRENLVKIEGLDEETVASIRNGDYSDLSEQQERILKFAEQVAENPHRITEDHVDALREVGLDDADVLQLLAIVGKCSTANLINTALDVDPADRDDELPTY